MKNDRKESRHKGHSKQQRSVDSVRDSLIETELRRKAAARREGARTNEIQVVPSKADIPVLSSHFHPDARGIFFPPINPFNLPASRHPPEDPAHLFFSSFSTLTLLSQQFSPQKSRSTALSRLHFLFFTHDERLFNRSHFDGLRCDGRRFHRAFSPKPRA